MRRKFVIGMKYNKRSSIDSANERLRKLPDTACLSPAHSCSEGKFVMSVDAGLCYHRYLGFSLSPSLLDLGF